jgi:predicted amidophosphoribosyltransferase
MAGHEAIAAGPVGGICPTCRRGFNPGVRVCPHDGDELVPPAAVVPRATPSRGKICPTCGGRFEGNAAFCGKDGTQLVLIN